MDPVDVLSFAVTAAQYIRSAPDPEKVLAGGYKFAGVKPPAKSEPFSLRVVRLMEAAGEDRRELLEYLSANAGPLPLNRAMPTGKEDLIEPDPEAVRLLEYAEENEEKALSIFGDCPFSAFMIATRTASGFFEDTRKKAPPLPPRPRCLIDYPMEVPVLFTIEADEGQWDIWEICMVIANQYARVYEQAERYGVWGHDMTDLVIENLLYYPKEQLIHPHIGS